MGGTSTPWGILVITLGTLGTSNTIKTGVTQIKPKLTPDTNLKDLAGNPISATQFTDTNNSGF